VGLSSKSMLGRILGRRDGDRLAGSVALAVMAVLRDARIIRAHDVAATVDALQAVAAVAGGAATPAKDGGTGNWDVNTSALTACAAAWASIR
jgi:dihydropteroate synthase